MNQKIMNTTLFEKFSLAISNVDLDSVADATQIPKDFLLGQDGKLTSHYIPFDSVNAAARVVLVGITPGFTQWINAMREAQLQLRRGATLQQARVSAKRTGAFSGPMRPNLVALLDHIGVNGWLGIASSDSLFGSDANLVQTTSVLRHPIFVDSENYNGTPSMIRTPFLRNQVMEHFAKEAEQLANPVYIPLGPKVSEALAWLANEGILQSDRILNGLPHPSGANAERIAYFLGKKARGALSSKTNPDQLDATRAALLSRVSVLCAA